VNLSVAVASGDAPRLRWLLNALEEQTAENDAFEVIVAHSGDSAVVELCRTHPLREAVTLRWVASAPGTAAQQDAAWRDARSGLVAFLSSDVRPPDDWVVRCLATAEGRSTAVIQGAVVTDPEEWREKLAPRWYAPVVAPPDFDARLDNSLWPVTALRELAATELGDEPAAGEMLRAADSTPGLIAASELVVYSRPVAIGFRQALSSSLRTGREFGRGRRPSTAAETALAGLRLPARLILAVAGMIGRGAIRARREP